MVDVDVLVENQTKQPSKSKVMKVWKDSDFESLISHHESWRSLWDTPIQIILHFRLFCDKNSVFCRCLVQSYVFSLLKRFSSGTTSKSQEITIVIAGLRFRLMAHPKLLDSLSNNVRQCFATCPAMLDYQCSITRLTMFDSLAKALTLYGYSWGTATT